MKCQNGLLRNERDSTICCKAMPDKRQLEWEEYLPPLILGVMIICLLIAYI